MTIATETKSRATKSGAGPKTTRRQHAEKGFTASRRLTDDLQRFRDLHLQLDEIVADAREFSDAVAERLRALHATPDGRSATVAETTSLPPYPNGEVDTAQTVDLITERLDRAVATMRDVHDEVDEEDPTTADLLHAIIARLEQYSWMVGAENRKPASGRS
jgi:starvation-inducible DNA-binding protein